MPVGVGELRHFLDGLRRPLQPYPELVQPALEVTRDPFPVLIGLALEDVPDLQAHALEDLLQPGFHERFLIF